MKLRNLVLVLALVGATLALATPAADASVPVCTMVTHNCGWNVVCVGSTCVQYNPCDPAACPPPA